VDLVTSLEKDKSPEDQLELVWRGSDPVAFSRVISALRGTGVPHHWKSTQDHLVFGLGIPRPRYEVRVFQSDLAMAKDLVAPIRETLPFEVDKGLQLFGDQTEIPPVAGGSQPTPSPGKWEPRRATIEVWCGDDPTLAKVLQDCLTENTIRVRVEGKSPGPQRLFARPEEASTAREIVREVLEGTPPA
jgi:hypothetical protein